MTIKLIVRRYHNNNNELTWLFSLERRGLDSFVANTYLYSDTELDQNYGNYSHIENGRYVYSFQTIIDRDGMPIQILGEINDEPRGPFPIIRQLNTETWRQSIIEFENIEKNN